MDAQLSKIENYGEEKHRSETSNTKIWGQKWENGNKCSGYEVAWDFVALQEEKEFAINGELKVSVREETSVVSSTSVMSVQNRRQKPIHLVSHQNKEVKACRRRTSGAAVHLGSSLDSLVKTSWNVLAPNHFVTNGIVPNVVSRNRVVHSANAVGLRISGHRAAGRLKIFTEEPQSLGTNSTSTRHKSYAASCMPSMRPRRRVEIGQEILKLKETDQATFFSLANEWCLPAQSWIKPEESEPVIDSGASIQVEQERPELCRMWKTAKVSRNSITVVTANGEVHNKEEATENDKELYLFVTVRIQFEMGRNFIVYDENPIW